MLIDTHLHLGGCCTPEFVWGAIRGIDNETQSIEDVISQMTFGPNESPGFLRFLDKFKILDRIPWNEDMIDASIMAISSKLADDGIDYAWMDFSVNKYLGRLGWNASEAVVFIHDAFRRYRPGGVGLILALKYESEQSAQHKYARLLDNPTVADKLVGIDLVGNEAYFDADFYRPIFRNWNKAGKMTRAHVGESGPSENIRRAIIDLGVTNIAHGLRVIEDNDLIRLARDRGITFDMAATSNYLTGVIPTLSAHPLRRLLRTGLKVTLGSDDPVQCQVTLQDEYKILESELGCTKDEIAIMQHTAVANTARFKMI